MAQANVTILLSYEYVGGVGVYQGQRQRNTVRGVGVRLSEAEAAERAAERASAWRPVMSSAGGNRSP